MNLFDPDNARASRRQMLRLLAFAMPAAGLLAACGAAAGPAVSPSAATSPAPGASTPASAHAASAAAGSNAARPSASSSTTSAGPVPATTARASTLSCTLTPEQEVGPYYLSGEAIRQDITDGQRGIPLQLRLTVLESTTCQPLANAAVDIWHANAAGDYSGFGNGQSSKTFLRGIQLTDASGVVQFQTIYPGWYQGRATHIHIRVRVGGAAGSTYSGGHISHTGQLFFSDDISGQVYQLAPYTSHQGSRTLNTQDGIFTGQYGSSVLASLTPLKAGSIPDGFTATMTLGVAPSATPSPVGGGGAPGGGPGPGGGPPPSR